MRADYWKLTSRSTASLGQHPAELQFGGVNRLRLPATVPPCIPYRSAEQHARADCADRRRRQVMPARRGTAMMARSCYPAVVGPAGASPRATAVAVPAMNGAAIMEKWQPSTSCTRIAAGGSRKRRPPTFPSPVDESSDSVELASQYVLRIADLRIRRNAQPSLHLPTRANRKNQSRAKSRQLAKLASAMAMDAPRKK